MILSAGALTVKNFLAQDSAKFRLLPVIILLFFLIEITANFAKTGQFSVLIMPREEFLSSFIAVLDLPSLNKLPCSEVISTLFEHVEFDLKLFFMLPASDNDHLTDVANH